MDTKLLNSDMKAHLESLKKHYNINWYTLEDLVEIGKKNQKPYAKVKPMDIHTLCYTSGTTGNPKGVMHYERNLVATNINQKYFHFFSHYEKIVH